MATYWTYRDKKCSGCIYERNSGSVYSCSYFEMAGHSRLSLYDYDLSKMPKVCEQKQTKKRGRPKRTKKQEEM